jgi:hypothetical protein
MSWFEDEDRFSQPASITDACQEWVYQTASADPKKCSCRGNGWILTDFDTWHSCPAHFTGQRHPEDEDWRNEA